MKYKVWVKFSDIIIGDDTKYKDHHLSIGLEATLSDIDNPTFQSSYFDIKKIKEVFQSLK